jgi:hypothetical protein
LLKVNKNVRLYFTTSINQVNKTQGIKSQKVNCSIKNSSVIIKSFQERQREILLPSKKLNPFPTNKICENARPMQIEAKVALNAK